MCAYPIQILHIFQCPLFENMIYYITTAGSLTVREVIIRSNYIYRRIISLRHYYNGTEDILG